MPEKSQQQQSEEERNRNGINFNYASLPTSKVRSKIDEMIAYSMEQL